MSIHLHVPRRVRVSLAIIAIAALSWPASIFFTQIARAASTDVSDCPTTAINGMVTISQDFTSSATTCFKVGAAGVIINGQGHTITLSTTGARLVDVTSTSTAIYNNVTVENIHSNGDIYVNGNTADGFIVQDSSFHALSIYSADTTQVLRNTFNSFILWGTQSVVNGNTIRGDGQRVVDIMGDGALGAPSFRGCPAVGNHTFLNNVIENTDATYSTDAAAVTVRCSTGNIFTGNTIIGDHATSAVILKDAANGNLFEQNQLSAADAPAGVVYFSDSSTYVPDPATNTFRNNSITGTTAPAVTELFTSGGNTFSYNTIVTGATTSANLRVDPSAGQTTPDVWDHNTIYNSAPNGFGLTLGTGIDPASRYATHFTLTNNIISYAGTTAYSFVGPIDWSGMSLGYNVYHDRVGSMAFGVYDFNADGVIETIADLSTWQTSTGSDQHSKIGDPQFSNVALSDFRLLSTSPASTTGIGGTNIGAKETIAPICTPNWQCTTWSACSAAGSQTRTCADLSACGVTTGKPAESQSCTPPDTTKPIVTITSPTNASTLWGQQTLAATATDNVGVVGVQFQVNGMNIGTEDLSAPYQTLWTPAANGTYTITAVARDAAGNTQTATVVTITATAPICTPNWQCSAWSACSTSGTQTRTCTDTNACGVTTGKPATSQSCTIADTTPPTLTITFPTGKRPVSGTTTISTKVKDAGGIAKVEFYINDVLLKSDTAAPYSAAWNTRNYLNGTVTIRVKAYDRAGNTTEKTVTVGIVNKLAAIIIRSSTKSTISGSLTFSITQYGGDPITKILVYKDAKVVSQFSSAPNAYTWNTTLDKNGLHVIKMTVHDAAGHIGKISWTIRTKN